MKLEAELAAKAIRQDIARPLKLGLMEAAAAIVRLATENMVGAIEQITIHQGIDPRDAVLVGGGGAAGLNSVAIARRLGCKTVVIPEVGAALSAAGALMSDLHADFRSLFFTVSDRFDFDGANATLQTLTDKCRAFIKAAGNGAVDSSIEYILETRYRHQIWEIDLPLDIGRFKSKKDVARTREQFDRLHEEVFAFRDPNSEVEFVGWRATARCKLREGKLGKLRHEELFQRKLTPRREAYFEGKGVVNARVLPLESMKPNVTVQGPAIVESPFTTVVIEAGAKVVRKRSGSLVITP